MHARPAALLVKTASAFTASVFIENGSAGAEMVSLQMYEDFDRKFLDIMATGGPEDHDALPLEKLQSGNSEFRCWSVLAGAVPRPVRGDHGVLDPDEVKAAIVPRGQSALAATKLICLENTHNRCGGRVLSPEYFAEVAALAERIEARPFREPGLGVPVAVVERGLGALLVVHHEVEREALPLHFP